MNTKNIALKARISKEGKFILPLRGKCMDPLLIDGDTAKIIPATQYSIGYLYLFELPDGGLAVHRLIAKTDSCVIMKGDHMRCYQSISYQNILGVVSELKLLDCESWVPIKQTQLKTIIVTYISKKIAKDISHKNHNKFKFLINEARFKALESVSCSIRKYWKNSCGTHPYR